MALSEAQMAERQSMWQPRESAYSSGVLVKYMRLVADASRGAVTDGG